MLLLNSDPIGILTRIHTRYFYDHFVFTVIYIIPGTVCLLKILQRTVWLQEKLPAQQRTLKHKISLLFPFLAFGDNFGLPEYGKNPPKNSLTSVEASSPTGNSSNINFFTFSYFGLWGQLWPAWIRKESWSASRIPIRNPNLTQIH